MSSPALSLEATTILITEEIEVRASIEVTFAALLDQLGPYNETEANKPMPMKLEAWPGGRWYRDLGNDNGHYWGAVQAINRPTLLEITGGYGGSDVLVSNLQYRASKVYGGTLIKFHHIAMGLVPDEHREGMGKGWKYIHEKVRQR